MSADERFVDLGQPHLVWAVGAIHGQIQRLTPLHDAIAERFKPGDRLLYLGNYIGCGGNPIAVLDELLAFRRYLLTRPGLLADDIIYLRGAQEEMWHKLLQIQFAPNPHDVLSWMLKQGVETTLAAYGGSAQEGLAASRDRAMTMTRWTNKLRDALRRHAGHEKLMTVLRRAAFIRGKETGQGALFVHSGLDPDQPLSTQKDNFWWDNAGFERLKGPYEGFRSVIRGSDPQGRGLKLDSVGITLDGRCGFGGTLIAAAVKPDGQLNELIEV